jgi:curved DNA-binding protein CbpA
VSPEAGAADLKKAFRKRARVEHPDVNKEPGAEERFIQVSYIRV